MRRRYCHILHRSNNNAAASAATEAPLIPSVLDNHAGPSFLAKSIPPSPHPRFAKSAPGINPEVTAWYLLLMWTWWDTHQQWQQGGNREVYMKTWKNQEKYQQSVWGREAWNKYTIWCNICQCHQAQHKYPWNGIQDEQTKRGCTKPALIDTSQTIDRNIHPSYNSTWKQREWIYTVRGVPIPRLVGHRVSRGCRHECTVIWPAQGISQSYNLAYWQT